MKGSSYSMHRFIEDHDRKTVDVLIIGGGITGAAVAYEAATRGLKVAMVERNDFGCATSASTSKLIHGGLRYLKNFEIGLVRESLRERRILTNIAPNFVYPLPLLFPIYEHAKMGRAAMGIGLTLYDALAFDKKWTWDKEKAIEGHRAFSKGETLALEPGIKDEGLKASYTYYDCMNIFPERLTLAFVKSAIENGAKAANHTQVVDFLFSRKDRIAGVEVRDRLSGEEHSIEAALTVNCGGPWADLILGLSSKEGGHRIRRSEGIHIITERLTREHGVLLMTREGRHLFVLPWRGYSLIGTTDEEYNGDPDDYRVRRESIEGLIAEVNDTYGTGELKYEDVLFAYGGLRPLVEDQTQGTYSASRKYEIFDHEVDGLKGLITVEGGKYTTSRGLAENALRLIGRKLGKGKRQSVTAKRHLSGCQLADLKGFFRQVETENEDFAPRTIAYLGRNYGTEYKDVLSIARADSALAEALDEDGEILAQVVYAVRQEMAHTLEDVVMRRTGLGTLGHPGDQALEKVARVMADELGWDDDRTRQELEAIQEKFILP